MPFRILIADDKIYDGSDLISELPDLLQEAGYEVVLTADGAAACDLVGEHNPDLILLDLRFDNQDINGIEVCRYIRENGNQVPIILLTAVFSETKDVLRGFDVGADDYVIRPRDNREILARVRANLPPEVLEVNGYILMDFQERRLWVKREALWQRVHLPRLEVDLLHILVANAGVTVTATSLKDRVWGKDVSDYALASYIRRLREKLEPDPKHPIYIETVHSLGYRFNGHPFRARPPG